MVPIYHQVLLIEKNRPNLNGPQWESALIMGYSAATKNGLVGDFTRGPTVCVWWWQGAVIK